MRLAITQGKLWSYIEVLKPRESSLIAFIGAVAALIAAGKMQSDCDDVRITDVNGKLLPHWVETAVNTCNNSSNSTNIWTKIPSIPTTGATIYFYYGKICYKKRWNKRAL